VLGPGEYADVRISGRTFQPPLTIDAHAATITGWLITKSGGIAFQGGTYKLGPPRPNSHTGLPTYGATLRADEVDRFSMKNAAFVGPGHPDTGQGAVYGEGDGLKIAGGTDITLEDSSFAGFRISAALSRIDRFRVSRITFTAMRSDGLQVAESRHGIIEEVECRDTLIRDKEHPDCIQLWSRPTSPPTSDIIIRKNKAVGNTQGISLFNHARDGVDDGGFDRITIEDNDVDVSYPDGITIVAGRDSIVRNNHVRTQPNARWQAKLGVNPAVNPSVKSCGNVVEAGGGKPGRSDGRC
jgi:hypothetical protein